MYFLPAICFLLGIFFFVTGKHHHSPPMTAFGFCLWIAAFGTGFITVFALTSLK